MKILSLDVATHCGWCTETTSGVWDFSIKKDESSGMRLIRFKSKLREVVEIERIDLITFEAAAIYSKFPNFVQSEMHGVLKVFCEENKIEHRSFAVTEVKKHATGKGNAGKQLMVVAAQQKLGYTGHDDNQADAMWIYDLTKSLYKQ